MYLTMRSATSSPASGGFSDMPRHMKILGILLSFALVMSLNATLAAEADSSAVQPYRPVTAYYTLDAGSSSIVDTYLTPVKYSGWSVGFGYDRWQALKRSPEDWLMNLRLNLNVDRDENITGNATMWNLGLAFSWGMYRRWTLHSLGGITVGAGPRARIDVGCLYTSRNGNNPASAKASATVDASAYVARKFTFWGKTVGLRYTTSLPLAGAFFSPDYGELYYEIWMGNHSGLSHAAWWGNYFRWNNDLMADIRFGGTVLTFGYRCDLLSTKVSHINTRIVRHAFVFGIGGEWISMYPGRRLSADTKIISAF